MGSDHVALLLAAGGSTRLGQPKQLLTRAGETLVHRTARLLLETRPRELVVVLGACHDEIAVALQELPHRAIVNQEWESGLASSLRAAGACIDAERVLIAICDQPALQRDHLDRLLNAASPCAATDHSGCGGVPAVADRRLWEHVETLRGDRGLARLFSERHDVACLDFPELGFDLDTPADLAQARLRGWID